MFIFHCIRSCNVNCKVQHFCETSLWICRKYLYPHKTLPHEFICYKIYVVYTPSVAVRIKTSKQWETAIIFVRLEHHRLHVVIFNNLDYLPLTIYTKASVITDDLSIADYKCDLSWSEFSSMGVYAYQRLVSTGMVCVKVIKCTIRQLCCSYT